MGSETESERNAVAGARDGSANPIRLLMRVPVPWVFVLTYVAGVALELAYPPYAHGHAPNWIGIAGGVVFLFGAIIAGWALLIFHRARTTTVPGKTSAALVTWGPYRFTRNPMYVGLTLAYLGEAGLLKQVWPVVLLPLTVAYLNWIVIPVEERRLREVFSSQYERYAARVRRWF